MIELTAERLPGHLRSGHRWAVRPAGTLGTCGWLSDGTAWAVYYSRAEFSKRAIREARRRRAYFN